MKDKKKRYFFFISEKKLLSVFFFEPKTKMSDLKRDAVKYRLLRGLVTDGVGLFHFTAESYTSGEIFLVHEVLTDMKMRGQFVQILIDLDLVAKYVFENETWRLESLEPDGDLASMNFPSAATLYGEAVPVEAVLPALLAQADLRELVEYIRGLYDSTAPTEDDVDLDNCKIANVYSTFPCVAFVHVS